MSALEYNQIINRHQLPPPYVAWLMDKDVRTERRWRLGEFQVDGAVAILLRLLDDSTLKLSDIERGAEFSYEKKARRGRRRGGRT